MQQALDDALEDTPVVCILGPRQCGKSTLAKISAPQRAYITLDEAAICQAAVEDPDSFVAGLPNPVTLDEVQRAPGLMQAIKKAVDTDRRPGRFLLTGSANLLLLPQVTESLAGRMEIIPLQPLSAAEINRKPGQFLQQLLNNDLVLRTFGQHEPLAIIPRVLRGGYPEAVLRKQDARARQWHRNYLISILERDVSDIAGTRNPQDLGRLLEVIAHQNACLLNIRDLARRLKVQHQTLSNHLAILERLFLVRQLPAWHSNAGKRLIKTPKIHLVDSGLAATLARLERDDWLTNRAAIGHLLESFVLQQIATQAGWTDSDLRLWHYRDKDQLEVDIVLTRGKKVWGIEVKRASTISKKDGNGLRRLKSQAGKHYQGGVILYGGNVARELEQGIVAVPLAYLWEY